MKILRFGALWCPSCLIMRPRWDRLLDGYPGILMEDHDFDDQPDLVRSYQIGSVLPVIILENDGRELTRVVGEKSMKELGRWAEEWLK